ncbi:hypothetical protein FXO37_04950 [Capsicum annuum]|nr:hypothetical protein FXO37_04950 [Capsicum annuum]
MDNAKDNYGIAAELVHKGCTKEIRSGQVISLSSTLRIISKISSGGKCVHCPCSLGSKGAISGAICDRILLRQWWWKLMQFIQTISTEASLIARGQTTNVLVHANQIPGRYFMAARPFMDAPVPVDNKTATAIFQYKGIPETVHPVLPNLSAPNDTKFALSYDNKIRSLNSPKYPANAPLKVDRNLFYTIGLGINACPTCVKGTRFSFSKQHILCHATNCTSSSSLLRH